MTKCYFDQLVSNLLRPWIPFVAEIISRTDVEISRDGTVRLHCRSAHSWCMFPHGVYRLADNLQIWMTCPTRCLSARASAFAPAVQQLSTLSSQPCLLCSHFLRILKATMDSNADITVRSNLSMSNCRMPPTPVKSQWPIEYCNGYAQMSHNANMCCRFLTS